MLHQRYDSTGTARVTIEVQTTSSAKNFSMIEACGSPESVAIIGNSPKVLENERGAEIDSHDAVIRLNDGRTVGFERYTGTKTTVRFIGVPLNPRFHDFFRDLKEEATLITRTDNAQILLDLGWNGNGLFLTQHNHLPKHAFKRLSEVVSIPQIPERNPRSGIAVLSLLTDLMRRGKRVSLYGFEVAARSEGAEHFFEDGRTIKQVQRKWEDFHCPMQFEFDVLRDLEAKALITIN